MFESCDRSVAEVAGCGTNEGGQGAGAIGTAAWFSGGSAKLAEHVEVS
jgi:hypothetical protein